MFIHRFYTADNNKLPETAARYNLPYAIEFRDSSNKRAFTRWRNREKMENWAKASEITKIHISNATVFFADEADAVLCIVNFS